MTTPTRADGSAYRTRLEEHTDFLHFPIILTHARSTPSFRMSIDLFGGSGLPYSVQSQNLPDLSELRIGLARLFHFFPHLAAAAFLALSCL
jgi:hypothetical protein